MTKQLRQVVTQDDQSGMLGPIPKRIVVQWIDSENGDSNQVILDYDAMTTEQKTVYDSFVQMSTDVMNQ